MGNLPAMLGLRHIALRVQDIDACRHFYVEILGMHVEWQPDADNIYLTSGSDNLALHKSDEVLGQGKGALDHFGFLLATPEQVDQWYEYMVGQAVKCHAKPKNHRDGARSFYCNDPAGNTLQFIYHPPISNKE